MHKYICLFLWLLFLNACSNAQRDKVIYESPEVYGKDGKISITQSELAQYLQSRKITGDTTGKTKDYLKLIKSAKVLVIWKLKPTYEEALLQAEENLRLRNMVNKVLVIKSERKMYLQKDGQTIKTFSIALGPNPVGQKEYEGDGKTPEGNYTLDWQRWETSTFHSFHISYPNAIDSARAKIKGLTPGSNIMVHGTSKGAKKQKDWTNGCIALTNSDMIAFKKIVFQDTQIEIRK